MRLIMGIILAVLAGAVSAFAEMGAVSTDQAEVRSAPSFSMSYVTMLAPRHYPLVIHATQGDFVMVSDYLNNTGWIDKNKIGKIRTVIVNTERTSIYSGPGSDNPLVFTAQEGVAFKVLSEAGNWLHVEHENGMSGWLSRNQVWGE